MSSRLQQCPKSPFSGQELDRYNDLEEHENVGAVEALIAESLSRLGEEEKSWEYRFRSLQKLRHYPSSVRLNNVLLETADLLLAEELLSAALHFQGEGLAVAVRTDNPISVSEFLLLRGRTLARLGRKSEAFREFDRVQRYVSKVSGEHLRKRLKIEAALARAETGCDGKPRTCISLVSEAIAYCRESNIRLHLPYAFLLRARSYLTLGEKDAALGDLLTGIDTYEKSAEEMAYSYYLERVQYLFDEIIRMQVLALRDPEAALSFAEQAREGMLRQATSRHEDHRRALSSIELQAKVPEKYAIIEYISLPDYLCVWVIRRGSLDFVLLPVTSSRLEAAVIELRRELPEGGGKFREASAFLFDVLLRAVLDKIPEAELVLVPDRSLNLVPFAALLDRETGRYLTEDRSVAVAPSASLYLQSNRELGASSAWRLLAVGNPASHSPILEANLPQAELEVAEVASLYAKTKSVVLKGPQATKPAVVAILPFVEIFHFAGHGRMNTREPALSSILLASEAEEVGEVNLYAHELHSLDLRGLRLVVLSACQTGAGNGSRSASLSGVANAFLAAGVPTVLAQQWRVNDEAASRISVHFHRRLLEGSSASSALRSAQLELLHSPDVSLRAPSAWAGFQIIGGGV